MEEPIQKWPVPRHRHFLTWALVIIFAALAGTYWRMNENAVKRIASYQREVEALRKDNKEMAAAQSAVEKPSPAWSAAVSKVPLCGQWATDADYKVPSTDVLEGLGVKDIMAEGYAFADICADVGDARLAFLASKPAPDMDPGAGEKDLFGLADMNTGRLLFKRSAQKMGLGADPTNFCRIDGVVAGKVAGHDRILLYCGPKNGGLTSWYAYDINEDALTLAQEYTGTVGSEYIVREGAALEQFHIRRRP